MYGMLFGNKNSIEAFQGSLNKVIAVIDLSEDRLLFTFADGTKMKLSDEGQSCCEHRYLHTDDDIQSFVGATLMGAEVREASEPDRGYDVHEIAFLVVKTNKGSFTIETHNEHNGYYGGFLVRAAVVE